jgi:hypothetical protein
MFVCCAFFYHLVLTFFVSIAFLFPFLENLAHSLKIYPRGEKVELFHIIDKTCVF